MCKAVGLVDRNRIPDARMTASSFYDSRYRPSYGRLNESSGHGGGALKLDLTEQTIFKLIWVKCVFFGVATQGLLRGSAWTTSYKLQLSTNGTTWNTYRETNIEKVRRELYVIDVFRN